MFKKGNFDSSFNGPIESVDDDNEKDFLFFFCFCFFAHESDSSRSTSSQTKKGRRKKGGDETFFSLGAIINSLWGKVVCGRRRWGQFLAVTPVSLFCPFFILLFLLSMLLVYTQSKLVPCYTFPRRPPAATGESPSVFFFLPVVVAYWE